ncbi:signal peptidase I [Shewanella waksmanii]|uniref:signal peptidase I n=1 Tax=Shewanella waksmanii TaxID=213783 RepID=UPI003737081E
MLNRIKHVLKQNQGLLTFILLMCVFRSAVADWNHVPSGSMKPTILAGDRLVVNKMAYDLRLPFTQISMLHIADPAHGDIITFESDVADERLVKRVIGLPGDTVAMHENQLFINGNAAHYQSQLSNVIYADAIEQTLNSSRQVRLHHRASKLANFNTVTVPDNHYLVLGDNRDASADSRVIGFVPRHEITGKAHTVAFSNDLDNHYLFRKQRFWLSL